MTNHSNSCCLQVATVYEFFSQFCQLPSYMPSSPIILKLLVRHYRHEVKHSHEMAFILPTEASHEQLILTFSSWIKVDSYIILCTIHLELYIRDVFIVSYACT